MSFWAIAHTAWDARDEAIREAVAAGKSQAEAEELGRKAERASWNVAGSMGIRPLTGALTGAAIGSAVPVIGTGLGALIGYIGGTISAARNPNIGKDLGNAAKKLLE
jgi:uncharacterized membrane protein